MENNKRYANNRRQAPYSRSYYVDGNAVRKAAPAPYRTNPNSRPSQKRRPEEQRADQQRRYADRQRQVNQRIAMQNREKALRLDLRYTIFLGFAVIIMLASCVFYLNLQNTATQKNKTITALKSELASLEEINVATKERINDAIDLERVRKYATETLGMVNPDKSQIITYHSSDDDYVKQYQDIPKTDKQ